MGLAPGKQLERVGEDINHRFNRLNGSFGRARDVEDEALPYGASDSSRQASKWIHGPHGLSQAWGITVDDPSRRFGRHVGGGEPCAAGRHDEPRKGCRECGKGRGNRCKAVRSDTPFDNVEAMAGERVGERLAGLVLSSPPTDRFGDGEDLCIPRHGRNASGDELWVPCRTEGGAAEGDALRGPARLTKAFFSYVFDLAVARCGPCGHRR